MNTIRFYIIWFTINTFEGAVMIPLLREKDN
jgi:hypothetical protein